MSLRLTIHSPNGGSFSMTFDDADVRLGRASFCEVRLPYPVVSSHHLTISGGGADWRLVDVGSTNGTTIDGRRVAPRAEVPVTDGMVAEIHDVRIELALVGVEVQGFTLGESGTLLRKMVSEAAQAAGDASNDTAFFEVLEGSSQGTRVLVPDELEDGVAGDGADCELRVPGLKPGAFRVGRDGDGFRIRPGRLTVFVADAPLPAAGAVLRSGQHVVVDGFRLLWFDPLEPFLDALDDSPPEATRAPTEAEIQTPAEAQSSTPARGLTLGERFVLVVSVLLMVAAIAALVVILRA